MCQGQECRSGQLIKYEVIGISLVAGSLQCTTTSALGVGFGVVPSQFPPGFGKRGEEKRSATETHQDEFKPKSFVNIATVTNKV